MNTVEQFAAEESDISLRSYQSPKTEYKYFTHIHQVARNTTTNYVNVAPYLDGSVNMQLFHVHL